MIKQAIIYLLLSTSFLSANAFSANAKCLLVTSYHDGYQWQDDNIKAIFEHLQSHCEIKYFQMDSKRNKSESNLTQKAAQAYRIVESWKPNVVIATDDNASKYFVVPYMRNHKIPVVFNGVNWTIDQYGYPFQNTSGMIEMQPIRDLLMVLSETTNQKEGVIIADNTLSERKTIGVFITIAQSLGMQLKPIFVEQFDEFKQEFLSAQDAPFVIVSNNAGIKGWNKASAISFVNKNTRTLTASTNDFMVDYVGLVMSHVASEQGEFAAKEAIKILRLGESWKPIIVWNHKTKNQVNATLLNHFIEKLPSHVKYTHQIHYESKD
ncbi:hypothetical protein [Vibrio marisflavi]|nr:hypothetical protein [Vibrio marisflavi]